MYKERHLLAITQPFVKAVYCKLLMASNLCFSSSPLLGVFSSFSFPCLQLRTIHCCYLHIYRLYTVCYPQPTSTYMQMFQQPTHVRPRSKRKTSSVVEANHPYARSPSLPSTAAVTASYSYLSHERNGRLTVTILLTGPYRISTINPFGMEDRASSSRQHLSV